MEQDEVATLCRSALERFGTICLDNIEIDAAAIGPAEALIIAAALKSRGGREPFLLGRRIERLVGCR